MPSDFLKLILTVCAGIGAALIGYALAYTHGNPRPDAPDPYLAFYTIPLQLVIGVLVALIVWRTFSQRQASAPEGGAAERMVLRLAFRRRGAFTLDDLVSASPLTEPQARDALARLVAAGRVRDEGDGHFRLP